MPSYRVSWVIDVEADNPSEAAQEAFRLMQDGETTATVFETEDGDGNRHEVDLRFEDQRAVVRNAKTGRTEFYPL